MNEIVAKLNGKLIEDKVLDGKNVSIELKEGDYMQVGDIIGTVAAPTKYFTTEGANVYFKLTLNGEPCDPLNQMS